LVLYLYDNERYFWFIFSPHFSLYNPLASLCWMVVFLTDEKGLKPEEDEALVEMTDRELAIFLNGLIVKNRGKREGPQPVPEKVLNNNIILRKMKIALELRAEDIVDMFALIGKKISKHELSAFFRHPDNKSYQPCLDQYLRNFFNALQAKYKPKNA